MVETHDYCMPFSACRTSVARLVADLDTGIHDNRLHASTAGGSGRSGGSARCQWLTFPTALCGGGAGYSRCILE